MSNPVLVLVDVVDPVSKALLGRLPIYAVTSAVERDFRVPMVALVRLTDNNITVGEVFGEAPLKAWKLLARRPAVCRLTDEAQALMPVVAATVTSEDPAPRSFTLAEFKAAGVDDETAVGLLAQESARQAGVHPVEAMRVAKAAVERFLDETRTARHIREDAEAAAATAKAVADAAAEVAKQKDADDRETARVAGTPPAEAEPEITRVPGQATAPKPKPPKDNPRSGSTGGR